MSDTRESGEFDMLKQLASLNVFLLERVVLSGTSLPNLIQDSILLI